MNPSPSEPEVLRQNTAVLATRSKRVTLDEAALEAFVATAAQSAVQRPVDPAAMAVGDASTRVAFVLLRDATNFGSGYHPHLRKLPGMSGARTTGQHLADFVRTHGPLSAEALEAMTPSRCAEIFDQPHEGPAFELMGHFARAWNELGTQLRIHYAGSFGHLVEDAARSGRRLVRILSQMPCWHDVVEYDGLAFPFMKRAQLATWGLARVAPDAPGTDFDDLDSLTIFADNLIPHVLRVEGVLRFASDLDARIDREELLEPGSADEIEIRALAVHACERIVHRLRSDGHDLIPLQLSAWLWGRGQQPKYKARPRHRARTFAY